MLSDGFGDCRVSSMTVGRCCFIIEETYLLRLCQMAGHGATCDIKPHQMQRLKKKVNKPMTDKQRLEGSKFRILNEKLYTTSSDKAQAMFRDQPQLFDVMHRGFANQAETWPVVPVDEAIKWLKANFSGDAIIADMGCGDAKIAAELSNKVFSFDFRARNSRVTACDMAKTPLEDHAVDVVVFVMSLMGTNLGDFIREARRILKDGGVMLVIEITSRIDDVDGFVNGIEDRGFKLRCNKELTNYFTWLEFNTGETSGSPGPLVLKPCLYKRR